MVMVTTGRKPKPFSWSYSKLKNFETCPKKHWSVDLEKKYKEGESEQLKWGDFVHKGLASTITNRIEYAAKRITDVAPVPVGLEPMMPWVDRILTGAGTILVEQQMAITKDFAPTTWFGNDAWYRGIGDVVKINGDIGFVIDWKTGKILEDSQQLALMAACLFAHYPALQAVRSEFVWLKEGPDCSSREDFLRSDMPNMWRGLWPRIEVLKHAYETTSYPPKPSGICKKYCPVTDCPYHGVGSR